MVGKEKLRRVLKLTSRRKFISREALSLMGIPIMYQGLTWENYKFPNKALEKLFKGYTDNCFDMYSDNVNLLLTGSNDASKTYVSSIILQYCYSYYFSTRLVTFKELISKTFKGDGIEDFLNAQFLVIDELGAEVSLKSDAEKSLLEDILKQRFAKGYPTIICSNLSVSELKQRYGNTFYSMLSEFVKVEIVGQDGRSEAFRRKKALDLLR